MQHVHTPSLFSANKAWPGLLRMNQRRRLSRLSRQRHTPHTSPAPHPLPGHGYASPRRAAHAPRASACPQQPHKTTKRRTPAVPCPQATGRAVPCDATTVLRAQPWPHTRSVCRVGRPREKDVQKGSEWFRCTHVTFCYPTCAATDAPRRHKSNADRISVAGASRKPLCAERLAPREFKEITCRDGRSRIGCWRVRET